MCIVMTGTRVLTLVTVAAAAALAADPGSVNYVQGAVFLEDELVHVTERRPLDVAVGQTLRTEAGNAEMLATEYALIRFGEDTEVELVASDRESTTLRLREGSIIIDADKIDASRPLTVLIGDSTSVISSKGEYRFDVDEQAPTTLQVLRGKVVVTDRQTDHRLKKKQTAVMTAQGIQVTKSDGFPLDDLTLWHEDRTEVVGSQVFLDRRDALDMDGLPSRDVVFGDRKGYQR